MSAAAYMIRNVAANMISTDNFRWPRPDEDLGHGPGVAVAPDWDPTPRCGGGLHGLLDGVGDYGLLSDAHDAVWLVCEIDRAAAVAIDDYKVKVERATVVYAGPMVGALTRISAEWVRIAMSAAESTITAGDGAHAASTGDGAHAASTGDRAHAASTGNRAHAASTGNRAHAASTGNRAHAASTGYGAHAASTGYGAHAASTGDNSIAGVLGLGGRARAGVNGTLVLARWDKHDDRHRLHVAYVGEDGIEAGVWYRLDEAGRFVRADADA